MGPIQLVSEKMPTTLSSTALSAYPVRVILLNVSARRAQGLLDNGPPVAEFPPICYSQVLLNKEVIGKVKEVPVYGFTSSITMPL